MQAIWDIRRRFSLRKQLLTLLIVFALVVTATLLFSAASFIRTQYENMIGYQDLYSDQLAHSTRQTYASYKSIAYSVAYSSVMQTYIELDDDIQRYEAYLQVYNLLNNTIALNSNLMDIAVLSPDGNSISLATSPRLYDRYAALARTSSNAFSSLGTLPVDDTVCHILSLPIHRLTFSGENRYLGTVLLAINNSRFFNTNAQPYSGATPLILLADEDSTLLYGDPAVYASLPAVSGAEGAAGDAVIQGTRYLLRWYQVTDSGARLYILFDLYQNMQSALGVTISLSVSLMVVLLLLVISFLGMWLPVSAALRDLTQLMASISASTEPALVRVDPDGRHYSCSETHDIFHTFDHMIQENSHLNQVILDNYAQMMELEVNNRQTEIAFLRSQINPHFLYNTLTTICGMASDGQDNEVIEVTGALANIFRYSIQGGDMVSMTEELSIVDAYLRIQSCRFGSRLNAVHEIHPAALDWRIPKMIIQPLVENAIVHGLEPSLRPCQLTIAARCEGDRLIIRVDDTGVGMSADRLDAIRAALAESAIHRSANAQDHLRAMDQMHHSGIGLLNVNSRIVLYYGQDYALTIDSTEGRGTSLIIRIPRRAEKGDPACIQPSSSTTKSM